MPDMLQIKGRFSVPGLLPDAFGLLHPGAFSFGEDRTSGRRLFACAGTRVWAAKANLHGNDLY